MSEKVFEIFSPGEGEIEVKKSRFIGNCISVKTEAEIEEYLSSQRKKHYDARHICYAYILDGNILNMRCSDDGEPSQTAGRPILEVIEKSGTRNVLITVTRYFGGILLGTGGLSRAYRQAAQMALESAVLMEKNKGFELSIESDYTIYGKIENLFRNKGVIITETEFKDNVIINCMIEENQRDSIFKDVTNISNAKAKITVKESCEYGLAEGKIIKF